MPAACGANPALFDVPSGDTGLTRSLIDQAVVFPAGEIQHQVFMGGITDSPGWLISLTFMLGAPGAGPLTMGIKRDSLTVVDGRASEFSPNRVLSGRDWVIGQIPVTTWGAPITGTYEVEAFRSSAAGGSSPVNADLKLTIFAKTAWATGFMGTTNRPRLPLAVVHAGKEPGATNLACAMTVARAIWARADLDLFPEATVTLTDETRLSAPLVIDPALGHRTPALGALLRESVQAPGKTLAVFLVPDIQLAGGGGLWAVTGGIPVAPIGGTTQSGIAASALLIDRDPVAAGRILAHEIGHALGLFHTTEGPLLNGSDAVHDQLEDTPGCPPSADADGDKQLTARECAGHDAANLMFWDTTGGATALSKEQSAAVRRSALVR